MFGRAAGREHAGLRGGAARNAHPVAACPRQPVALRPLVCSLPCSFPTRRKQLARLPFEHPGSLVCIRLLCRLTAAAPMENPYCSCKLLTRVRTRQPLSAFKVLWQEGSWMRGWVFSAVMHLADPDFVGYMRFVPWCVPRSGTAPQPFRIATCRTSPCSSTTARCAVRRPPSSSSSSVAGMRSVFG